LDNGALAATTRTDEGDRFSGFDYEGEVIKDLDCGPAGVGEGDVDELGGAK